ncbi:MAG: dephospho-CoA kinase [Dehalococcoidales bacterium]|nr:dephospho-CoA kinase [Dehalococcoidales bacterium]
MKILGLTGGIGSGKSTAARFLKDLGAEVIDLDKAGHEALKKGGGAYEKVVKEFGAGILDDKGEIDRSRLGEIVFKDKTALKRLTIIIHPVIDEFVEQKVSECRRKGVKVLVLEAAAMLESAKTWQVDEIWVTTAEEKTVLNRLKTRPGFSEQDVWSRIRSQLTNAARIRQADVVIDNNSTLEELKAGVKAEWQKLRGRIIDS